MKTLTAKQFNERYPVGSFFIYQPNRILRGGPTARTWGKAEEKDNRVMVEIDIYPHYVDISSLTILTYGNNHK